MTKTKIRIIGCGLAGAEAAYMLARAGVEADVYDIKPEKRTPAHSDSNYGELVCSNSLKGEDAEKNACGLLKAEMRSLGSLILRAAEETKVPAGNALAVDRIKFAKKITEILRSFENLKFHCQEVREIDEEGYTIIATGPLTTEPLAAKIGEMTGEEMFFFDAAAPIISADSIDTERAYFADRYGGEGDYLNCPLTREEYYAFVEELLKAERAPLKEFESDKIFEGCMPVEVMAARGADTLRFGPMKPVGLTDPASGKRAFANVQLRRENEQGSSYNMVGFQTNLKFGEQKRVFSMIPALKNAEFLRYGVMHKNIYLNSPKFLNPDCSLKGKENIYFAGQITGVEGYVESAASGMVAAMSVLCKLKGNNPPVISPKTMMGALQAEITSPHQNFQPVNANYGILRGMELFAKDKQAARKRAKERAISLIEKLKESEIYE